MLDDVGMETTATNHDSQEGDSDKPRQVWREKRQERKAEKRQASDNKKEERQAKKSALRQLRQHATATAKNNLAIAGLIAGLGIVGVVNFSLSFAGLYDYGKRLAELPFILPAFVPVGVEGLAVGAIAAIYILRHAPLRVRFFCWFVFTVPLLASIGGNVSHAVTRSLHAVAVVGSAAWPIFLALATHLVVVTVRHLEMATLTTKTSSDSDKPKPTTSKSWKVADTSDTKEATPKPVKAPTKPRHATTEKPREYATLRAQEGATVTDIHRELVAQGTDINRRNIERWTKPIRDNAGATS